MDPTTSPDDRDDLSDQSNAVDVAAVSASTDTTAEAKSEAPAASPVQPETGAPRPEPALTVTFRGGNQALLVRATPRRSVSALLAQLGLPDQAAVLIVAGGAATLDPAVTTRLRQLFERGVLRAVRDAQAVVVDGGTASGVMAVLGEALAGSDEQATLVGVAPAGKVTYNGGPPAVDGRTKLEPNHTHFILAKSDEWGGETTLLFDVADTISSARPAPAVKRRASKTLIEALAPPVRPIPAEPALPMRPSVLLVAGGGSGTVIELTMASRRGIPIVVLAGTGGFADEVAAAADSARRATAPTATIALVEKSEVLVIPAAAEPEDLHLALAGLLREDDTLDHSWRQHAAVARTARRQQASYRDKQKLILGLGVFLTVLVAIQVVLEREGVLAQRPQINDLLHLLIVVIPITIGVLGAAMTYFRPGPHWIVLRGTAESIKGEIYRYRARSGKYSLAETRRTPARSKLAAAVGSSMGSLMRTDVNMSALEAVGSKTVPTSTAAGDDGRSPLTPERYVKFRIDDQIDFYRRRAIERARDIRNLRWLILGFGGLGTLLAAYGAEIWVAVTVAAIGAFATYLEAMQLETTLMLYNQAATDLASIRAWWLALSPSEQTTPATVTRLVERSEEIMRAEHAGWVQQMQDAMTKLRLDAAEQRRDARDPDDVARQRPRQPAATGTRPAATGTSPAATGTRPARKAKKGTTAGTGTGSTAVNEAREGTLSQNGSGNGAGNGQNETTALEVELPVET